MHPRNRADPPHHHHPRPHSPRERRTRDEVSESRETAACYRYELLHWVTVRGPQRVPRRAREVGPAVKWSVAAGGRVGRHALTPVPITAGGAHL